MPRKHTCWLTALFIVALAVPAGSGQTILRAYAPAGSDGQQVILVVDWAQVKAAAPSVTSVLLRRRPEGIPTVPDTVAVLPADSARFVDQGLDRTVAYHYFAYFKNADGETQRFGGFPAVVHLGPLQTLPDQK